MSLKAGMDVTVVRHDHSEVTGLVGSRDDHIIEILTAWSGLVHIPWQAIREIEIGPGYEFDDEDGDDGNDDDGPEDPRLVMANDIPEEPSMPLEVRSGFVKSPDVGPNFNRVDI